MVNRSLFASDRHGNFDVFVMSANGGTAQRLTTNSAGELPSTFTPDGKYILFSASIQDPASSALFPTGAMTELYKVPVTGGRTEQILGTPAEAVCFDKSGNHFFYQDRKGFEDEWRKHHTSSITRDVWMYDIQSGKHINLTQHAGEDRNPVLAPDGQTIYFLSERDGGSFNVYSFPLDRPQSVKAITDFKTHPVRFLSMSNNGTLCYGYNGEIYTQQNGSAPQKVQIEMIRDDQPQSVNLVFSDRATLATISRMANRSLSSSVVKFSLLRQTIPLPSKSRILQHVKPGLPLLLDNRTLAYASERNGNWQLILAKIARERRPQFPQCNYYQRRNIATVRYHRACVSAILS